jgi:hypothetical protein
MEQRLRVEDGLWGRQARWADAFVREGQETESTDGTVAKRKRISSGLGKQHKRVTLAFDEGLDAKAKSDEVQSGRDRDREGGLSWMSGSMRECEREGAGGK